MIELPKEPLDSAYVDNVKGVVFLHFKNSADQYFTYRYYLDKAFSFDQHMARLAEAIRTEFPDKQAYALDDDLKVEFTEPANQDWHPAPMIGDSIISFRQYKAHANLAAAEDRQTTTEGQSNAGS